MRMMRQTCVLEHHPLAARSVEFHQLRNSPHFTYWLNSYICRVFALEQQPSAFHGFAKHSLTCSSAARAPYARTANLHAGAGRLALFLEEKTFEFLSGGVKSSFALLSRCFGFLESTFIASRYVLGLTQLVSFSVKG